ncbi:response regulator transcription factor [Aquincola sp. MAHUQ-54]|uniref:Response regulator transcription factor n=1 Tax=Aquincola agrisoli TaxID=3119538 RepID=A0AAW9QQ31_9BURK
MAQPVSILLVDDHRLVREGIRHILSQSGQLQVEAEAADGEEALESLRRRPFDVAIVDLGLPGMDSIELIRRISGQGVSVLVLTMHDEEHYAVRAFRAGASGYLTKDAMPDDLIAAVHMLAAGGTYVTPTFVGRLARGLVKHGAAAPHALLSEREFQVFRRLVTGQRVTDIAQAMGLSVKTVSTHKTHVLSKMGMGSPAELVKYAMKTRLFGDEAA